MPRYMESSCCRGRRPSGVFGRRRYPRPDLVARLLRDRRVARIIAAPSGFGKSCLAFEYADVVFGFQRTFWINARSPCFLRDLDAGVLLGQMLEVDRDAALVVFEDVPVLDPDRSAAFASLVDELLKREIEVVATCVPSAKACVRAQRDCMMLSGRDLLLGEDEAELAREAGVGASPRVGSLPAERVACLCWADDGVERMLEGLAREELPGDVRLFMLVFLAAQSGTFDDVAGLTCAERFDEVAGIIERGYPMFGVDVRSRVFAAVRVGVDGLARIFSAWADGLASSAGERGEEEVCGRIADVVMRTSGSRRACALMGAVSSRAAVGSWLARRGWNVVFSGDAAAFLDLRESAPRSSAGRRDTLAAMGAWACAMAGDEQRADECARLVMRSRCSDDAVRVKACLALVSSDDDSLRSRARSVLLEQLLPPSCEGEPPKRPQTLRSDDVIAWPWLVETLLSLDGGIERACVLWESYLPAGPPERAALLLSASWVMREIARRAGAGEAASEAPCETRASARDARDRLAAGVARLVGAAYRDEGLGWCALAAWRATGRGFTVDDAAASGVPADALTRLAELDVRLARKPASLERSASSRPFGRAGCSSDVSGEGEVRAVVSSAVPILHVSLFGGLEVRIGDTRVDADRLNRSKSKALLAILAIGRGRETARDRLAELLWPASDPGIARRNFYSVLSQLKRALSLEDGSCPYLTTTRASCRLDTGSVVCDLDEFENLCRSLMFGGEDERHWERSYAVLRERFAEDLMPAEASVDYIARARSRCRVQLVDALVAASARLGAQGEPRGALWFAREAVNRDASREDAYVALMEAQIASGQRAAAIDAYFACRRYLSEELGIDPSPRIVELYRSVIETEAAFI